MIPHSQPFSISVSTSANPSQKTLRTDSWSIHSHWLQPHPCLSCPPSPPLLVVIRAFGFACIPWRIGFPPAPLLRTLYKCTARSTNRPLLRKTNPIPPTPEPPQPLLTQRLTPISRPPRYEKANPKSAKGSPPGQTQSRPVGRAFLYHSVHICLLPNCAKQTQFPKPRNHRKTISDKDLHQYLAPLRPKKTNPIQIEAKPRSRCTSGPNPPAIPARRYACPRRAIRHPDPIYSIENPGIVVEPPGRFEHAKSRVEQRSPIRFPPGRCPGTLWLLFS